MNTAAGFASLSGASGHACGLAANGEAYCWGDNEYGKLGTGTTTPQSGPAPVAPPGGP